MIYLKKPIPFRNFTQFLFLVHLCFIFLTPFFLENFLLSLILPPAYLIILFLSGLGTQIKSKKPVLMSLAGGYLSQLPGIVCASIIFSGKIFHFSTPEALDFVIQLWHAPFSPAFPLLPRARFWEIPFYYLLTLTLSFFLPFFPASGALLKSTQVKKLSKQGGVD